MQILKGKRLNSLLTWDYKPSGYHDTGTHDYTKNDNMKNDNMKNDIYMTNDQYYKCKAWTTLEEDYIAFLLPAPKCTNCNKQVLMLELSRAES
jgi:hypothetical protein